VRLVCFYYKNISWCTVLWISGRILFLLSHWRSFCRKRCTACSDKCSALCTFLG